MRRLLKPALFVLCSLPLAWLLARAFGVAGLGLGANPIDELMDRLGEWGLRLLLATLCATPLAVTLRKPWLMGVRRMIGLFAFTYLALHFLNWLVLDQWFDAAAIPADIAERPYITVGLTAFVLLVPLAVTSTAAWMRRLGRRWHQLHRLIYPAAILKVTIDPANIFHAGELPRMSEILDEAFALLGKDIVLAHAKDLDHDGDAGHKAAGQGKLDYGRYLALLRAHGYHGPLLLHGLSEAQVPGCVAFLREKLAKAGG